MKHIILVFTLLLSLYGYNQNVSITVLDAKKQPLPGATVQCIKVKDSSQVYAITDGKGMAEFKSMENTLFNIRISFVGFETLNKSVMIKPTERNFTFRMQEAAIELDEVTVVAPKPMIRQEEDKMIIDPQPLESISSNTLEVLESTPGLYVDQDNGIYLSSATPAKVYINGREQKMSNQDITTILQSLPPGSVKQIEVMRTPSARYDAASTGGIINIVLKKGVKIGRFGSVNGGMSQGKYGDQFAGFSLNNSGNISTSYVNMNFNRGSHFEELNTFRYVSGDTLLTQSATTLRKSPSIYTGYGISFTPDDKLSISYDGRITYSMPVADISNMNYTETPDLERIAENNNDIGKEFTSLNIQQDLNLNYKIDTAGSELDTKFGFNFNKSRISDQYTYSFALPYDFILRGNGENLSNRKFAIGQTDLTYKLPKKISVEAGLKSSVQLYQSSSDYYVDVSGVSVVDPLRTNTFKYLENINAGYLQLTKTFGKDLVLKTGLRAEHTLMDGEQKIPSDTSFFINRVDFFPYVYLSRKLIHMLGIDLRGFLIYRRTIERPGYEMLNPYIDYVDQYMYNAGNPALKPQFTNNYEFNISFNEYPVLAIGQNLTTDVFTEVVYADENIGNVVLRTYDNLGTRKETYFRGMAGIPPGGKYFFAIGAQYNLNDYDGYYQGEPLKYSRDSWRFFTFHVLRLTKTTKLVFSGFLMIDGQMGLIELEDFGAVRIGIRQSFFNDKLQLSVNARDIFRTMVVGFKVEQNDIVTYGDRYTDDRRIGMKLTYRFGIPEKKQGRGNPFDFEGME